MGAPLFEFDGVSVRFGDTTALDSITVRLPDHGVTAILGASGSGKSTLLRLCNRLEVVSCGTVSYRGHPLDQLDPRALRREVGMVFQRPVVFHGSVRDNLNIAAPESDDDIQRTVLERVSLSAELIDREAVTLSGGEAQRLGLARTLLTDPAVLLLDEPTSALDASPRLAFERTVRQLAEAGTPALWVTHELEQVRRVADQLVVLDRGRLALVLDDLTDLASHPVIAKLFDPEGHDGDR
ncbi:MAG: ATP-binding cassette domain-containing protein [Nitriliruptoraceae bacterium]